MKLLRGNPGKRSIAAAAALEQRAERGVPKRPHYLSRRLWKEMTDELDQLGVLAKTDRGAVALLVEARQRWERCVDQVKKLQDVLVDGNGKLYRNPWAIAAEKAWQQYLTMCTEFGVTPSSRPKVAPVAGGGRPPASGQQGEAPHDASARFFQ